MVVLITIEMPDDLAQQWVDEGMGFKVNDDDAETLRGVVESAIHEILTGNTPEKLKLIMVETWKMTRIEEEPY